MEHHADFAIPVTQRLEIEASVGPDDGLGPIQGRAVALGWWTDSTASDSLDHRPTGTLYLVVDERRFRPYWVKQGDLAGVHITDE